MISAPYLIYLATIVVLFAVLGLSYNLLSGFTGLSNLGQPGLFLIGAYATVLLQRNAGLPSLLALAGGILAGSIAGLVLSLITRRGRGDAVAVMGLWFMLITSVIALNWIGLTRGALGIPGIARPALWSNAPQFLILMLLAGLIAYGFAYRLTHSPFGRALGAVRDDELAAATLGKHVFKTRVIAFVVSGGLAGLGGGLFAYFFRFIDPSSFFIAQLVTILAIVYAGGLASLPGTFAGTLLVIVTPELLRFLPFNPEIVGALRQILFSLLVLAVLILRPKGILGKVTL